MDGQMLLTILQLGIDGPVTIGECRSESTVAQNMSVAGVLLAAGAGVRYGMPKVRAEDGAWLTPGRGGAAPGRLRRRRGGPGGGH